MADMNIRKVAVVGAGIGGLMSALAITRQGISVTVLERDAPPPVGVAPADSMDWLRKGVPQSLHPHFL
ncbi:MAG: FAD-dependent oxidoreductase, partial [Gammaproteobacteria bacterium]|nr:FAD-dependent oxidoreductase [Gammaproteobacteria bacterium]